MTGNLALSSCTKQRLLRFSLFDRQKNSAPVSNSALTGKSFFRLTFSTGFLYKLNIRFSPADAGTTSHIKSFAIGYIADNTHSCLIAPFPKRNPDIIRMVASEFFHDADFSKRTIKIAVMAPQRAAQRSLRDLGFEE
jgi:hypothetical protein